MQGASLSSLAPWAVSFGEALSREHDEPADPLRRDFALDTHRIVNSTAFRRLSGKTQVFAPETHDHFRTRLKHTVEVTEIARTLARALRANESLAEAITLAHDLGHPPFGHAGEVALGQAMAQGGGFNHNTHSLRVVEYLEHPFPAFRGLNLTRATRDGLRLHATRFDEPGESQGAGPSVEAQIASLADRIAYDCHDLEDAIGADFLSLDQLSELPLWQEALRAAVRPGSVHAIHAVRRVVLDRVQNAVMLDAIETSQTRLSAIGSSADAAAAREPLVRLSDAMATKLEEIEDFVLRRVYRREEIAEADARAVRTIRELFDAYRGRPGEMPARYVERIDEQGLDRVICDYVAGMTDRYCVREHERLVS